MENTITYLLGGFFVALIVLSTAWSFQRKAKKTEHSCQCGGEKGCSGTGNCNHEK
ncbi:hypothetical protein [Heliorestis convoluta]|uniref:FeoB-associated Cys-rich membrane protein n=1 Tax=Heliorestis convoluta TaxID=356322 RepID=A0A5Q2MYM5_9FIRM|nr:hypothetical protein [Heliorestis convoluta]QGG46479.1 hypothetical protein FTV88_0300 [Heliorestis convoluta]